MSAFRIVVDDISVEIASAFTSVSATRSNSIYDEIVRAVSLTIRQAGEMVKTQGRANIAAAGFGSKWQNAWRVQIFPKKGDSINAAVWAFHRIPYSLIYETGGTIVGKHGMLWLPLDNVPKMGRRRATPRRLVASGVKLVTLKTGSKRPLLGTNVRVSRAQAGRGDLSVSLSKLRSGTKGTRGVVRAVPLFVGISAVTLRKRFDIQAIVDNIRGQLGTMYFNNLKSG